MNKTYPEEDDFLEPLAIHPAGNQRYQQPQVHRQMARQFDAYGGLTPSYAQPNSYATIESGQYDVGRFNRMPVGIANGPSNGVHNGGFGYEGARSWNPNAFGPGNGLNLAATTRPRPANRGRSALPQNWVSPMDQQSPMGATNGYHHIGPSSLGNPPLRQDPEEELIPTAIVIKNIPFAVKKEQLLDVMSQMNLPLPYAFNYHFDNGVFRGLAFANFTSPDETKMVIQGLNHQEVGGRTLRVEYKKMLPLDVRERIERDKRERRGQLEEQHRPLTSNQLAHHPSVSSMNSYHRVSPSPQQEKPSVDYNDAQTREFHNQILLFKCDTSKEFLDFPADLTADQRKIVHTLAHEAGLYHESFGHDKTRKLRVSKTPISASSEASSSHRMFDYHGGFRGLVENGNGSLHEDHSGRGLGQASRAWDLSNQNPMLRGQYSSSLLKTGPDSPFGFAAGRDNLRAAKSHADLRTAPSPSPSPSLSQTGYPPSRFEQYFHTTSAAHTPTLTHASSSRDETGLVNGFGDMTIGASASNQSSPRHLRAMWSRNFDGSSSVNAGAVGSNRTISANIDEGPMNPGRSNYPARQPRGPTGMAFSNRQQPRPNGHEKRSSDGSKSSPREGTN